MRRFLFLICGLPLPALALARLGPGSPAPAWEIKDWVKGAPVTALDPKQTYVIEFWATWCGPCIEMIPHLTEVAKRFPAVRFVGVSIMEKNEKGEVRAFAAKMGAKMDYAVAFGGFEDGMARSWFAAAGLTGVPATFVVKGNVIQWIGHPARVEPVLRQLADGTFDLAQTTAQFGAEDARKTGQRRIADNLESIDRLFLAGERAAAKAKLAGLEEMPAARAGGADLRAKWRAYEDPEGWKAEARQNMPKSEKARRYYAVFAYQNAAALPELCKWAIGELTDGRFSDGWYVPYCAARAHAALREFGPALDFAERAKAEVRKHEAAHPDQPPGNALEVLNTFTAELERKRRGP